MGGNPEKYRDYVFGQYSETSDSLELGTVIHEKFLLNKEFVTLENSPTEAILNIINKYFRGLQEAGCEQSEIEDNDTFLLEIIRENNFYNNRKDESVLALVVKEGKDYFDFLKRNTGKKQISPDWKSILDKLEISLQRDTIQRLVFPTTEKVFSEQEIYFDWESADYKQQPITYMCKAKIDRFVIDEQKKTYRIIDLKSTSGYVENFISSVLKYKYHRQLAFYRKAVESFMQENGYEGYTEEGVYILALETKGYCRARLFQIEEALLQKGEQNAKELLKRISYHEDTLNWVYPIEEETNQGIYTLKIEE